MVRELHFTPVLNDLLRDHAYGRGHRGAGGGVTRGVSEPLRLALLNLYLSEITNLFDVIDQAYE